MAGEDERAGNDPVTRIETLLTQLNSRFELVVEVAEGFGGRLSQLRDEMMTQFSEVGRQIRFLSDQIGASRASLEQMHAEFTSEMVRINEAVGAARIQLKQDLAGIEALRGAVQGLSASRTGGDLSRQMREMREELRHEVASHARQLRDEIGARVGELSHRTPPAHGGSEVSFHELQVEVKSTNKTLGNLIKKFERFDDRITVAVKDQDQRLRKLERHAKA
jgi:hypothetical protein